MNRMKHARRRLAGDRNQCPGCGQFFNSSSAFDAHRTGPFGTSDGGARRRCLTVEEMLVRHMARNLAGYWIQRVLGTAGIAWRRGSGGASPENHRV